MFLLASIAAFYLVLVFVGFRNWYVFQTLSKLADLEYEEWKRLHASIFDTMRKYQVRTPSDKLCFYQLPGPDARYKSYSECMWRFWGFRDRDFWAGEDPLKILRRAYDADIVTIRNAAKKPKSTWVEVTHDLLR